MFWCFEFGHASEIFEPNQTSFKHRQQYLATILGAKRTPLKGKDNYPYGQTALAMNMDRQVTLDLLTAFLLLLKKQKVVTESRLKERCRSIYS